MEKIRRKRVDSSAEKKILIGMIVNDDFCRFAIPLSKKEYFSSEYIQKVYQWVSDYYYKYKQSIGKDIQDVYEVEKENLNEDLRFSVSRFLDTISKEFESNSFDRIYYEDKTESYFRERSVEILSEKIRGNLGRGKLDQAEKVILDFGKVRKSLSKWLNPFDRKVISETFVKSVENKIFRFTGELGDFLGWFKRGWLIGFMAPMKRGKSWVLLELAVQGILSKIKLVYISLEMDSYSVNERIYKRLMGENMEKGDYVFPIFDCENNQAGNCLIRKKNKKPLIGRRNEIPEFDPLIKHDVCTKCRNTDRGNFKPTVWYNVKDQDKDMNTKRVRIKLQKIKRMVGDNIRVISYPEFSATWGDVEKDLDQLEVDEDFIPKIIIVDYFDILADDKNTDSERGRVDAKWKYGKRMTSERNCLVVTVSQSTRSSFEKRSLDDIDASEDIRKMAHVELMMSLNQTPEEKDRGIWRFGILAKRHGFFSKLKQVMVLRSLDLGQPVLDSEKLYRRKKGETFKYF